MIASSNRWLSFARRVRRRAERVFLETGNRVCCPYCEWTGWRFLPSGSPPRPNRLCPSCGALERYRMLALLLEQRLSTKRDILVLELAPKRCLARLCASRDWQYLSSDLVDPNAMLHADLRSMPLANASVDVLVCFHVMEHIEDDATAFAEMARIIKPDGFGVICVPLGSSVTQEGAPRSEWTRLYGQYDHVRLYGMDIADRLHAAGLDVEVVDTRSHFDLAAIERHGLTGDDRYLFVIRPRLS